MATFVYRCPNTRLCVQGWSAEEVPDEDVYQTVSCLACRQIHLVNQAGGRVVGTGDEQDD